ncbi:glutathione S-transferase Mu 1-like [Oppia nitens]|uniref:glutathione S-transferase Mu 1-like n=1 Tax=Oppia nitens TaxID=1686743 RepID=UPI0023DAB768|nr:glutathione S-transferase Mu 1-like [Oppia nitens]
MALNLPVFGYWNIRGLGQPIRLLLAYTETEYEDKRFNYGPPPEDRAEWYEIKPKMGLDFPNLPYYIDDEVKLTQSLTIMRYLSKKHRLDGHNERERIRIDMIENQLKDYRADYLATTFDPHFEVARVDYIDKKLPTVLKELSSFLGDHPYFAGKSISYVDFIAYEFIDLHYYLEPELFANTPNLKEFLLRIEELPTIHKYQYSDNYIRWPSGLVVRWYKSKYYSTFNKYIKN